MQLRTSTILGLVGLILINSNLATEIAVPPGAIPPNAGGEGIQAALDALPTGGEVVLAAGRYYIKEPIILRQDNQTLRGCGTSTVLYLADGANCPVVVLGSLTASMDKPTKGLRLADLLIDGNRKNQQKEIWRFLPSGAGVYNNGVDVWGPADATVEGVVCCHCRSGGMVTSTGTRRLTVQDYTAYDNQFDGLACYQTEESHFSHLNLHDNPAAGVSLDLNFNRNVIQDAVLTSNDLGIFMRQSCSNEFDRVTISNSRHHGVFMAETAVQTATGWQLSPGTRCTENTFSKLTISHCAGKAFIVNDTGCSHNTIDDGQFLDNAQGGLFQAAPGLVMMRPTAQVGQQAPTAKATPVAIN
jgi:Periplasmic copper-binding protein (NosD)